MGTHPIFESDFDCLTEFLTIRNGSINLDNVSSSFVIRQSEKLQMPKYYRHSRPTSNGSLLRKLALQLKLVLGRRQEAWKKSLVEDPELTSAIQDDLEQNGFVTQQDRDDECQYILTLGQSNLPARWTDKTVQMSWRIGS